MPTFKSVNQVVNVWGGFSIRGRTPLGRIEGRLNQYKYRKTIVENLLPFMEQKHEGTNDFVLQEDSCGHYRAKSVCKYLREESV